MTLHSDSSTIAPPVATPAYRIVPAPASAAPADFPHAVGAAAIILDGAGVQRGVIWTAASTPALWWCSRTVRGRLYKSFLSQHQAALCCVGQPAVWFYTSVSQRGRRLPLRVPATLVDSDGVTAVIRFTSPGTGKPGTRRVALHAIAARLEVA